SDACIAIEVRTLRASARARRSVPPGKTRRLWRTRVDVRARADSTHVPPGGTRFVLSPAGSICYRGGRGRPPQGAAGGIGGLTCETNRRGGSGAPAALRRWC